MASILTAVTSSPSIKITGIGFETALNFAQVQKYLQLMLENGMVTKTDDGAYTVTHKGQGYLQAHKAMREIMFNESLHTLS